jgi:undecaprenyl pyrophosphate synthase
VPRKAFSTHTRYRNEQILQAIAEKADGDLKEAIRRYLYEHRAFAEIVEAFQALPYETANVAELRAKRKREAKQ